jgi:EAL domain-containing protein (putative c-di-GMP-specific phosphodiesterase class I)
VGELGNGPTGLAIVDAIVRLGHALDLEIVAEGVERPEQLELLVSLGCDLAQGFLLGVPGPADRIARRLPETPARGPSRTSQRFAPRPAEAPA